MTKELWNAEQTANYLGISKRSLYQRIYRGTIPYMKMGSSSRLVRFDPEAIQDLLESNKVEPFKK